MMTAIFWTALLLCVASFVVFAILVYLAARPAPPPPADRSPMDMAPHGGPMSPKEVSDVAAAFAKAGPAATAATLSIFFMSVALIVSGVVKIAVAAVP